MKHVLHLFNREDPSRQYERLQEKIVKYIDNLQEAFDLLSCPEDVHSQIQRQRGLLRDLPPLNLVFVGATKAGKSTLVNSILSRPAFRSKEDFHEVLPRRLLAETNAFWKVETSGTEQFEFVYQGDHSCFEAFDQLAAYVHEHYGRDSIGANDVVTIRVPRLFSTVAGSDFCLIDSPGLSEAGFPDQIQHFLRENPHIVVYAVPMTAGCLTSIDDSFLSSLFRSSNTSCVFVLTCYDRALSEADPAEVQAAMDALTGKIYETYAAQAFPTSCLVMQRGTFNPEFSLEDSVGQLDRLLRYVEVEFLRNSRLVVLKSIFSSVFTTASTCYESFLNLYTIQCKGTQTERMFELFKTIERVKQDLAVCFNECLAALLDIDESEEPMNMARPPRNLREHIERQASLLAPHPGGWKGKVVGFLDKGFWDQALYKEKVLDKLRPEVQEYITANVPDILRSTCQSFMQQCRAEIMENASRLLDADTYQKLTVAVDRVTKTSGEANHHLVGSVLDLATNAVTKLASDASFSALYAVAKHMPFWTRKNAAKEVALAVARQLSDQIGFFRTEVTRITYRLLDDLSDTVKLGVQDYYRTVSSEVVLHRHPELRGLHELMSVSDLQAEMNRLACELEHQGKAEDEERDMGPPPAPPAAAAAAGDPDDEADDVPQDGREDEPPAERPDTPEDE